MDNRDALIALNLLPEIGPVRLSKLLDCFGEPQKILSASERALMSVDGIGAKLCESAEDVISEFTHLKALNPELIKIPMPTLSPVEQSVYGVLSHEEIQQDEIIRLSRLSSPQVSVALLQLEMKKLITQHPGRFFRRFY